MKDARTRALEMAKHYKHKKLSLGDYKVGKRSKSQALEHYIAKRDKKKLPIYHHEDKKTPYKQLSIKEYESKYK